MKPLYNILWNVSQRGGRIDRIARFIQAFLPGARVLQPVYIRINK